ncbi:MAG: hypothetical protein J6B06_06430 [Lachnospiraceae bacterium]|nr:hypothetical protein [Lachnospiraceae bacterium]
MQNTKKLYYEDSHMAEFTAEVLSCEKETGKEGTIYKIVLDRTAFFPEGGGQSADTGYLNDAAVSDVKEKEGIIYHICQKELPVGTRVQGRLDFEKRFDKMQNHTGEHIVSGLVHELFGYENVGFHLGTDVTMDFSGELSKEDLLMIERKANEAVIKNIPVQTAFPDKETLASMTYRSKIELEGEVRIVTIPGYDCCACCAPHVRLTGEIGMIKLLSAQKYKGGTRVTMVCGFRALADYNQKSEQISAVSVLLSAKQTEIADAVAHVKEELTVCKSQLTGLRQQLLQLKVSQLEDRMPNICMFEPDLNGNEIRMLVNLCMEKCDGICIAFSGSDTDGYQFVAGSRTKDMREFGKALQEAFEGRGGGKPEMIQGSIKGEQKAIEAWILHKLEEN